MRQLIINLIKLLATNVYKHGLKREKKRIITKNEGYNYNYKLCDSKIGSCHDREFEHTCRMGIVSIVLFDERQAFVIIPSLIFPMRIKKKTED